jgi:hypothetical protein
MAITSSLPPRTHPQLNMFVLFLQIAEAYTLAELYLQSFCEKLANVQVVNDTLFGAAI